MPFNGTIGVELRIPLPLSTHSMGPNKIPTLSYQPPIITSIERNNAGGLLTGGVTFGGYMYRLVGTNFGIEVKTRNQLILEL